MAIEKKIQKFNPAARQIIGDLFDGDLEQVGLDEVFGSEVVDEVMAEGIAEDGLDLLEFRLTDTGRPVDSG